MAELVTIARPYAEAAFSLAKERGELSNWSDALALMVAVFENAQMQAVIASPKVTAADVERVMLATCGERIDANARNFIQLLASNGRLTVLPQIQQLFEHRKAQDEGTIEAQISTAYALDDGQLQQIVTLLAKRFQKNISPAVDVDPELIGGIKVQVGDKVWDASVRGSLQQMAATLTK
jgi:F-type H+-transporting ATPase subunit delta